MEMRIGKLGMTTSLFVAGGLLGVGVALLFAPQSGRKTRRDIRYLANKARHQADRVKLEWTHGMENMVDDLSQKLNEGMDQGRKWTSNKIRELRPVVDSGKQYLAKEIEKVRQASA